MDRVPDCLKRRYAAIDGLISELSAAVSNSSNVPQVPPDIDLKTSEPGIKLMCQFWNILKENPNCDLKKAVLDKMESNMRRNSNFGIKNYSCFMAMDKPGNAVSRASTTASPETQSLTACTGGDGYLSKVLCNLQEAATFDKECCARIDDLKIHQQNLTEQIQDLEIREIEGVKLLKKADAMWSCMEDGYKKKIEESVEMQKQHLREQREFEQSLSKWRQHRKDLEGQVKTLDKCRVEIKVKIDQKNTDLKFINTEIRDLKKKLLTTESDGETLNKSLISKQQIAVEKQKQLAEKMKCLQLDLEREKQSKADQEKDGRNCIKQAREDLQKICTKLLQKRMENEDYKAERDAILSEIELLKVTSEQCKERCQNRKEALAAELELVNEDIAIFRLKCTQCHKCVDTIDVRRFCTDCPKCMEIRDCIYNDDNCIEDPENDCVCMETKRRFMDNVFENMYNVLSAQIKTKNGKALAEQIFHSLRKSRNGKLNDPTRKAVQEFVLAVVKKNLNLTIIGGAVKTRCEMEPETYDQLMLCLRTVEIEKPDKEDKGTISKKEPCKRWGVGECHCPRGPAGCICVAKAPPTARDPQPCPPRLAEDYFDIGQAKKCPIRGNVDCGADCAIPPQQPQIPDKIAKGYQQPPCAAETCTHTKNLRTPQCCPICTPPPEPRPSSKFNTANVETKNLRAAQCGPICMEPSGFGTAKLNRPTNVETKGSHHGGQMSQCSKECLESHTRAKKDGSSRTGVSTTSSKLNMATTVETKGSQHYKMAGQMSHCSKECSESQSRVKKTGSKRSGDSPTFTKNMRAAQCALEPCSTQDYVEKSSDSPIPYRKLSAKRPKASNADWKSGSNVGAEALKSYSPAQNDCDCEPRRKRKEFGGRSYHTALISKKSSDHGNERRGIIKGKHCFCSDLIEVNLIPSKLMDVPRVQAEVLSGANVDGGTEPYVNFTNQDRIALESVVTNLTKPRISKHLKVIIPNVKGEVKQEFTDITVTSSGSMAMTLDEKTIEEIRDLIEENQVLLGVLRKTFSGHYSLEFNKSAASSAVSRHVVVKKTDSGHIMMEIHKDIIETLRPGANTQVMSKVSSMSIGVTKKKGNCENKRNKTGHVQAEYNTEVEEVKGKYDITRQSFKHYINQCKKCARGGKLSRKETMKNNLVRINRATGRQESLQSYNTEKKKPTFTTKTHNILYLKDEFQKMIENGHTALNITIVGGNGLKSIIRARITKTKSRHIAVDVKALKNIGQIANRLKDYPVSLIKTRTKYLLKLGRNNENTNALLRRNSIGDMLVVLKDPIFKYPGNMSEVLEKNETVFVARVRGIQLDDSDEPSLFLRVTSSGSFVFVLDKEFEQTYMKTVNIFGTDKCPVNLSINESGILILDFESCDIGSNGLLVKTGSGKLKIFTANPNDIGELQLYRSTIKTDVYKLFSKLYKEHLKTKFYSDILLNAKEEITKQKRLLSDKAAILKKTGFGKYTVVLNKDDKALFLNNVKNYISSSGNWLVPIKVTKDGEHIICLSHDHKGLYGSVRISNSGNIYVLIDENVIKDIDKKAVEAALSGSSSVKSLNFIGSLVDTCNKRLPTAGLMQSGESYDDDQYIYEESSPETSSYRYRTADQSLTSSWNQRGSNHYNTGFVSPNRRCSDEDSPSDVSPTGILRTTHAKLKLKSKIRNQNNVSKSISWKDIIDETVAHSKIDFNKEQPLFYDIHNKRPNRPDLSCLDYLDSMPPQLPTFLRNYVR